MKARASSGSRRGQAPVVVEVVVAVARAADDGDDAEGAADHERVGGQVEERAAMPSARGGLHADEDEAGVADRRVRQHPLHVGLHDGEHGADEQAERRPGRRRSAASRGGRSPKVDDEHPQQPGEAGRLHRRGHEGRRPGVGEPWYTSGVQEWNGTAATLKPKPDQQQADAGEQQARRRRGGWSARKSAIVDQVGGAGGAVDERDAVEEEGRREARRARST